MKVLKFGGTSVGSAERIKHVARLVKDNNPKIVVLSAMAGTTNSLVEISKLLHKKKHPEAKKKINSLEKKYISISDELFKPGTFRTEAKEIIRSHFDQIRSFTIDLFTVNEEKSILAQGEMITSNIFYLYLSEQNIDAVFLNALNFMRVDSNHEPDNYYIKENLKRELDKYPGKKLFVTQGYICRNLYGEIDNLKRGGSDYSVSLIAAATDAEEVQIWTDISGFHNNDPRYVNNTEPVSKLSFDEAAELAYFGAKILHPSSVHPAKTAGIPVLLKNTLDPEHPGTLITQKANGKGIKAIAAKDEIIAIKIKSGRMLLAYGFLRRVFEVFEYYKTPIDMITTSEVAVSLTIDNREHLDEILSDLKKYGDVELNDEQTIVCLVGQDIVDQKGYINKIFEALKDFRIRMISFGGSRHNISLLINSSDKKAVLNSLHRYIFG